MQSASIMSGLSFKKNPRNGQREVYDRIINDKNLSQLNIKLPTGYGKTITGLGCYSILKHMGRVDRLLWIMPTDGQTKQFVNDGRNDMIDVAIQSPHQPTDIRFYGVEALRKHRSNSSHVFVITIQSLMNNTGMSIVREMMNTGRWMIVVDEHHHYGNDKTWGKTVKSLTNQFLLAMSATPYRQEQDETFGKPDISILYRDAQKEHAVKELIGHSYVYRLDAVTDDGVQSFTTDEIVEQAGGSSPEIIENFTRKMRWSPKYVSPLVSIPIQRMIANRAKTGLPLQVLIGAMCVSHAKLVCSQVSTIFPDLEVDWVGTGASGRTDDENNSVLKRFCPPKSNGKRTPTLDVLVHVGMAGEGLDSVYVSEVVHLNRASQNNSNDQENGRAARFIHGHPDIQGHINFDSCSDYAIKGYVGTNIMDAMDSLPPSEQVDDEDSNSFELKDIPSLPEEPVVNLMNVELDHIDSGSEETQRVAEVLFEKGYISVNFEQLAADPNNPAWSDVETAVRILHKRAADRHNEESIICQLDDQEKSALSTVTSLAVRVLYKGVRPEQSAFGDIKKRINSRKKMVIGMKNSSSEESLKRHYAWLKILENDLRSGEVPAWLR